ncbi:MAG: hypothetical protein CSA96_10030 [Bacteroidetes bacterium]|nr:MAG: hypothetical protein CSA96_10030 [Bacteroidota bacterium]
MKPNRLIAVFCLTTIAFISGSLPAIGQNDSLELLLEHVADNEEKIQLLYALARLDNYMNRERALGYLEQIRALEGDDYKRAALLDTLGLFTLQTGDYEKALEYFEDSWILFKQLEDSIWLGNIANNMGVIYMGQGFRSEAMEHFRKAYDIRKGIGDMAGVALVSCNIALIYQSWDMYQEALNWQLEAMNISLMNNEEHPLSYAYSSFGDYYTNLQSYDSALHYHKRAMETSMDDVRSLALIKENIGDVFYRLGEMDSALLYLKEAVFHAKRINNPYRIAQAEHDLGKVYLAIGNIDSARANNSRSSRFAMENNQPKLRVDNYFQKSAIEEKAGNIRKALQYYQEAVALKEDFDQTEFSKFTLMERRYHMERENQENALLRQDLEIHELTIRKQNIVKAILIIGTIIILFVLFFISRSRLFILRLNKQLQKSEDELLKLNADKDKFFSIISHDLKSPFNGLLGISEILVSNDNKLSPKEERKMIEVMRTTILNVYKLLEDLLQWARTQTGSVKLNLSLVNVYKVCENVIDILQTNARQKEISLYNKTRPDCSVETDREALETIVRNLVANAIKFTNPGGKVSLKCNVIDRDLTVAICDTGIGMDEETLSNLFRIDIHQSKRGTKKETGTGLGLILCKELIESMGGSIQVESKPGKGSTFRFTLPKSNPDSKND